METAAAAVVVVNEAGIHARPSHTIVKLASEFDASISLLHDGRRADASSILSVMTLGAVKGTKVGIEASGPQADQAVAAMCALFESGFEED
ncbi:MAG: phosphocarrier protein HPr [Planctomycetota bacterium]|nr:MAG: phosphocarrier protein HPr [Planctomycetota bacterium]